MNLGEERFDSIDSDKKPRAGQILWIRGLTRLQTQVSQTFLFKCFIQFKIFFMILPNYLIYFIISYKYVIDFIYLLDLFYLFLY